jgi:IclR family transcriptional regulator, KDG regulon repressor
MGPMREEAFYNRSLERALQILNVFNSKVQVFSLAQLSEILNLPRATVLRLCSTLVKYGFLNQDQQSRQYSLGFRLFELGSIVFNSFSLRKLASPHVNQLQMKLGKTVFLGILDHDEVLYIDKRDDPRNPIRFTSEIGTRRPPYWGMLGSVLMAYLPDNEIERLLQKSPLMAFTKKSITRNEEFIKWLHQIRDQGFTIDNETVFEGIIGVSAPIHDFTGNVVAALGIGFIASSVDSKGLKKIVNEVIGTTLTISKELGYHEKNRIG